MSGCMVDNKIENVKREIEDCFYKNKDGYIIIAPAQKEEIMRQKSKKEYDKFYSKMKSNKDFEIYKGKGIYTTKDNQKLVEFVFFIYGKTINEELARKYLKETKSEAIIYNNRIIYDDGTIKTFNKIQYSNFTDGDSTTLKIDGEEFTFQFV